MRLADAYAPATSAPAATTACKDSLPMTFATQSDEAGKLLFDMNVNGRVAKAELDTGAGFLFLGSSDFFPYKMVYQGHPGQVGVASVDALIGRKSLKLDDAVVLQSSRMPTGVDLIVGNPILDSYDVVLHLRDPSICFVAKSQEM